MFMFFDTNNGRLFEEDNENLKDYYIAYFDILGYKSFFDNKENNHETFLRDILQSILDIKDKIIEKDNMVQNIQLKVFSDNFLLCVPSDTVPEYTALYYLIKLLKNIQIALLEKYSMIVRGGITKGEFFINDSLVFGAGLIDVVDLESKAFYPRIILKDVFNEYFPHLIGEQLIQKDADNYYYVNCFSKEVLNNMDKIKAIRKNCVSLVKKSCKYRSNLSDSNKIKEVEKTISKYYWLLEKYNDFCEEYYFDLAINYKISLNKRLYKPEIICDK